MTSCILAWVLGKKGHFFHLKIAEGACACEAAIDPPFVEPFAPHHARSRCAFGAREPVARTLADPGPHGRRVACVFTQVGADGLVFWPAQALTGALVPSASRATTVLYGLSPRVKSACSGGDHHCPSQRFSHLEAIHPRRQNAACITGPFTRGVQASSVGALVVVAPRDAQGR